MKSFRGFSKLAAQRKHKTRSEPGRNSFCVNVINVLLNKILDQIDLLYQVRHLFCRDERVRVNTRKYCTHAQVSIYSYFT